MTAGQIIEQVRRDGRAATRCRARRSSEHATRTWARRTRAPGWPAWCWPTVAGEDALVALYAAVRDGADLGDASSAARFGWTEQAFVEAWQQRLTDLAE